MAVNGHFYVLLLSMILVGASAAGDYSPSSNAGEVSKPQSKAPSGSYDKPVAQSMPKERESEKQALEKYPKSEPYNEPEFQHSEPIEKPDFHFPDMPHPEVHSESYEKPVGQSMPKPEEFGMPTLEKDPKSDSYGEHKLQHNDAIEKPDFHFSDMPHPELHSGSYEKQAIPSVPKPEELGMPEFKKDPKSKSYDEPKFHHNESIEKPDFHFSNMPHPELHSGSYEKTTIPSVPKPEELGIAKLEKNPKSESYDEPKFQHNEPIEKPDFHFPDMPHPEFNSESYDKQVSQWMPKPEESGMSALEKDPKLESYDEPKFQDNKPIEKPDFHFSDMPQSTFHYESYNKPVAQWFPKPEESEMRTSEKDPKSESYDEPKFQHNEAIKKPDFHFPDMHKDEPVKPVSEHDLKHNYNADPHNEMPKLNIPKPEEAFPVAVEGTVICKSPSGYVPIEGAVVRITCLEEDDEGYENVPVSCQTNPTNAKGYFFKTLPSNNDVKNSWENCKAFLEQSPMEECGVPSNVNKGIDGYKLSSHHILQDKRLKLYSVGPFFYTPEPKQAMKKAPASGY